MCQHVINVAVGGGCNNVTYRLCRTLSDTQVSQ
jgi:hypothetical protein